MVAQEPRPGAMRSYDLTCMNCSRVSMAQMTHATFLVLIEGRAVAVVIDGDFGTHSARELHCCKYCSGYVTFEAGMLVQAKPQRITLTTPGSRLAKRLPRETSI